MKIKDLIEKLSQFDEETIIFVPDMGQGGNVPVGTVEHYADEDGMVVIFPSNEGEWTVRDEPASDTTQAIYGFAE